MCHVVPYVLLEHKKIPTISKELVIKIKDKIDTKFERLVLLDNFHVFI